MKKLVALLAATLSGALTLTAVTPVAVWDGDFTATQAGFTLNRSGNAISQDNSTITIDQSVGVKVDSTTGFSSAMTVMFKYSDLAFDAQKTLATSFCSGYDENRTGVYAASGGTINGIWNTADWAHPAQTLSASSGVLAFCYSKTAGTSLYSVGASSRNELFNESGLKAGNDTAINGCTIGGERAKSGATLLSAATGMKITGIAIFDGILTEAEMTGYAWPCENKIAISGSKTWSQLNVPVGAKGVMFDVIGDATLTIDEDISLSAFYVVSSDSELTLTAGHDITANISTYDCSRAQGSVTLNILQGAASVIAGTDTVLNGLGTGSISIPAGKKLTISESGMKTTQLVNNGTLHIVGGSADIPIEIYDNGVANTGLGAITLAANAYVRNNATGGNKLYTVTGAADGSSTLVLSSGQNWGMTNGSQIRNCKVLVRDKDFWWERTSAFDKTVDLDYGTITLHLGNPDYIFEIGSVIGSGTINRDHGSDKLTIYADRIDGVLSGVPNNQFTITVKGSHAQEITSATGSVVVDGGIVRLGSQTIPSLQNGGMVKYDYSAMPTIQTYSGLGSFEVNMTGTELVHGTQYKVVDILGVTADRVLATGVDDDSFRLYTVLDGVVLADVSPISAVWTGNSGTWTDSTFDGKTISTEGEEVSFADATSGAESVTVALDGPKTVAVANFFANTTAYELTGGALAGSINIIGFAPVILKAAPGIGDGGLSGTGPIVLDIGANSVFTMSSNNTAYVGEATIASGTVKMGDAKSFGEFGRAASIRVKSGATLDANGVSSAVHSEPRNPNNRLILESGSSFSNSISLGDVKLFAFYDLTVEGDATIVADTANNGLTRHYNYETYVHLGTNTLTKTGSNTFYMSAPTIDGAGTIDVTAGVLELACRNNGVTHPTFADGTFIVRSGAAINLQNYSGGANLTAKKIILEGTGCITGVGSATATDGVELRTVASTDTQYPTLVTAATVVSATGVGTLAFGTVRPSNQVEIGEGVHVSVRMQNATELQIQLPLSRNPASVMVYNEAGVPCEDANSLYDSETRMLTISTTYTIEAASGTVNFDNAASWNGGKKPGENANVVIKALGDVTLSVAETYSLGLLSVTGGGTVSFSGVGTIRATRIDVLADTTYNSTGAVVPGDIVHWIYGTLKTNGDIALSAAGNGVNSIGVLDVESGTLTLACGNRSLQGTIYVRSGATLAPKTTDAFNYDGAQEMHVYGTLAMGTTRWSTGGSNTIYLYGGASVTGIGNDAGNIDMNASGAGHIVVKRNESTGDAVVNFSAALRSMNNANGTIAIDPGVTLVMSGKLIEKQKITKSGSGSLVFDTPEGSSGGYIWVADGAIGGRGYVHNITMENGTTLQPTAAGLSVNGFYVMPEVTSIVTNTVEDVTTITTNTAQRIALNFNRIDPDALSVGDTLTLLSVAGNATLSEGAFAVNAASRYATTINDKSITATVRSGIPQPFMHYDFNGEATAAEAKSVDSLHAFTSLGGTWPSSAGGKNGTAGRIDGSHMPYYDSNTSGKSPFYAGEMTVTTLLKVKEANNTIIWNLGSGYTDGIALIAKDSSTMAVVSWAGQLYPTGGNGSDVVSVTGIGDLIGKWHLVSIVANANGTTLYVDGTSATVGTVLPTALGGQGQFGSIHGTAKNYNAVSGDGFLLDDWRVYDAALTAKEVKALKRELNPDPLFIRLR